MTWDSSREGIMYGRVDPEGRPHSCWSSPPPNSRHPRALKAVLSTVNIYLCILSMYQLCISSKFMLFNVLISERDWQYDIVVSCYPISGVLSIWLTLTQSNLRRGFYSELHIPRHDPINPNTMTISPTSDQNTRDLIVLTWPENELQMIISPLPPIVMTALSFVKSWKHF